MAIDTLIKPSQYYDSVSLMQVATALTKMDGVEDAAVVMATEANKAVLREAGLFTEAAQAAGPNDLVIIVKAIGEASQKALTQAETLLTARVESEAGPEFRPRTIRGAMRQNSAANLAVVSVPGEYAAAEAWDALKNGLHVLLFSDNVPVDDEVALKTYARDHGLLLMGPDAGTAIINGAALGFANVVPRGPVGIVAASGTGLQEVTTLLANARIGTSQAIGVGSRDVKPPVNGLMMLAGLKALQADPASEILLLVSKPPAAAVAETILAQVKASTKPTVVCFLGGNPDTVTQAGAIPAFSLHEAAYQVARQLNQATGKLKPPQEMIVQGNIREYLKPAQKYLRGLFSGGTLASEALLVCRAKGLTAVWSNVPLDEQWRLPDVHHLQGHAILDLGEDAFTVGRPHPMLDNDLRIRYLLQQAEDPTVGVILLDIVLGYGAHPDPAAELGPAIEQAVGIAHQRGDNLFVIGSVTGTDGDPQNLSKQVSLLAHSGLIIQPSNADAAQQVALIFTK